MQLLLIGEIARRSGVCEHTVRLYANRGLINAQRDNTGRGLFTADAVEAIRRIYEGNMARRPPMHRQAERQTERQAERQPERQAQRQPERHAEREATRQAA
jgi:DNA-binding transcriptional MerR regulator